MQDALNLFFKGKVHYLDCKHLKNRDIVHGKENEAEWNKRVLV
jgi:hypothetical protein